MTSSRPVIDLHTHSTSSDGTQSPSELVETAAAAGLDVLAITDHDTVGGWEEATAAALRTGMTLVRGIEISCRQDGRSVHLLGYLTDPVASGLMAELARARKSRVTRLRLMVGKLAAAGIPLTYAEVQAQVAPGATPGRPHIADALVANGTVAHRDEAFATWLHDRSEFYVDHYAPHPAHAVRLVREAGGVAVIAHPFTRSQGRAVPDRLVEELAEVGLAGVEVDHPDHGDEERRRGEQLARSLGLLVTGSSDYHGSGKGNRLGQHTTHPEVLREIEDRSSGRTEVVRP